MSSVPSTAGIPLAPVRDRASGEEALSGDLHPNAHSPRVGGPGLELAAHIHVLVMAGRWHEARERYGDLVAVHQRRASRLAHYYLRDAAEAGEAVQDAFVKAV